MTSSSSTISRAEILDDVATILGDFGGRGYSGTIAPETRFFADLGLASIDAVVLGETLSAHYGRPLPFGELMADLGRRAEREITVGEVVAFLHAFFHSVRPEPCPSATPTV
jgi:acyl carrier protein